MVLSTKRTSAQDTFLDQLQRIEGIIASIARRQGLAGDDADDFASWTKTKLIENDYAIIKKFQGRSSISTYLTVVIANLFRDYRTQQWGRWRPSVAAKRLGVVAVRLETLLYRDGYTLAQAIEVIRSTGVADMSDRELSALAMRLPARVRPSESGEDSLTSVEGTQWADGDLWRSEQTQDREAVRCTLERALANLPPEDQVILRLRYWEGFTIAEIARVLHLEQKPLYRRIENDLGRLRGLLEADGVNGADVAAFFSDEWPT